MLLARRFLAGLLACALAAQPVRAEELPELGEWAEAKLRTVHRLRSALYSEEELLPAWRAWRSNRRDCAGFGAVADCGHTVG